MDDILGFFLFILIIIGCVFLMVFAFSSDKQEDHSYNKRYELCLKNHMQWVDNNCVSVTK